MWPIHSAFSFSFQYPLVSLTIFGSCLRLLPRLSVTYILSYIFPSITCFRRQFLRKMWPIHSAFSFNFQYPLVSLTIFGSCLRLLPHLSVTYILSYIFPSITCFRRQFLRKMCPIQLAFLPSFLSLQHAIYTFPPCLSAIFLYKTQNVVSFNVKGGCAHSKNGALEC